MKSFSTLTDRGQVGRLRRLARAALPAFGLPAGLPLALLNHGENTTFSLVDPGSGDRRMMRVCRPGYQSDTNLRSELAWLSALAEAGIVAPAPLAGEDGAALQIAAAPGVPEPRRCVLFAWVDGRTPSRPRAASYLRGLGALTARLHQHAADWTPPAGFDRRAWHADGLLGPGAIWGSCLDAPGLSGGDRRVIARARDRAWQMLDDHGQGPDRYGLIHADLHSGNVLVRGGQLRPIDFDDCGPGYLMYDAAVGMGRMAMGPEGDAVRARWAAGYRAVRPLAPALFAQLDLFLMTRRMTALGWLASRADVPHIASHIPEAITACARDARIWLETGRL